MAKLVFAYPIEEVHGKLKGKFGASRKKAANNKGERDNFSVMYGTRSTAPSQAEITRWSTFATNARLVAERRQNLTKRAADKAAAKAAGMTYTAYLWSLVKSGDLD